MFFSQIIVKQNYEQHVFSDLTKCIDNKIVIKCAKAHILKKNAESMRFIF